MKNRYFYIKDIDCTTTIEYGTRKEILSWIDEMCRDLTSENADIYDYSDDVFEILYNDGTTDYINQEYDGHKIRRQNIATIIYHNSCTDMIYGHFSMNEYGITTAAFEDEITDNPNIKEVATEDYTECA